MKKLGIIAGSGQLPLMIIEECKNSNIEPIVVLISGFAKEEDFNGVKKISTGFGKVGKILKFFKSNGVTDLVFAGAVKKPEIRRIIPDFTGIFLLFKLLKLKLFGDDSVLSTVVEFTEKRGIKILPVDSILKDIKIKEGVVGSIKPNKKEYEDDVNMGVEILKKLSDFDIGQCLAIQNGMVLGIEGPEGTEKLIQRCGELAFKKGRKPILVKIKKINQTRKADLPSIGTHTINQLKEANFAGLAIDMENVIVLDKTKTIEAADKNDIFIIGKKI